ncbi:MAG: hypothetical protein ACUVUB_06740 [Candidatus Bathyarchaeia archaeon]
MIESRVGRKFCPRCGSLLVPVGGRPWCSHCRTYPLERGPDISRVVTQLKGRIRVALERIERKLSGESESFPVGRYPTHRQLGGNLPPPMMTLTPPGRIERQPAMTIEEKVFKYIEAHDGTISLSQASSDLNMSISELQAAIGRLRSAGFLSIQTGQVNLNRNQTIWQRTCVNCLKPIEGDAKYCSVCGFKQPPFRHNISPASG